MNGAPSDGRADVVIVRTGAANLASVVAAFTRLNAAPRVVHSRREVEEAPLLVVPGVGTLAAAMQHLRTHELVEPLRARLVQNRPTLCICLGMQLLLDASDESPGVAGLGVAPGRVTRFDPSGSDGTPLRVPHFGWTAVEPAPGFDACGPGAAYFAHSFRVNRAPPGWAVAHADHGGRFVAAMQRGRVLACQFHPELSADLGLSLLRRWMTGGPRASAAPSSLDPRPGPTRRVIPCLDVRDGRVVKGVRFQNLRDAGDPVSLAAAYERQGADEITLLDVSATPEGRASAVATVAAVRERLSIPLTVGGGVRTVDDARRLLEAGADKIGVNTAAVADPSLLTRLAERFGRQCVVLAIDAAADPAPGRWRVVVRSGADRTALDAIEWAREGERRGAGELLLTSWDRDGTRAGYDLDLLRAASDAVRLPVIASGGAAHAGHLSQALQAGADAVLAASIFHDAERTVADVKRDLARAGHRVRITPDPPDSPC